MSGDADPTNDIVALREKAKKADSESARADAAERKLAFVQAGVPIAGPVAEAFVDRYDGELTTEAIVAEAERWNLVKPDPAPDPKPDPTPDPAGGAPDPAQPAAGDPAPDPAGTGYDPNSPEVLQQQMQQNAQGAPAPADGPKLGGHDAAFAAMETNLKAGMSRRDAQNQAFTDVIAQAGRGDAQARFDPVAWEAEKAKYGNDDS